MREALRHGAAGFVPKAVDKATLTRAIRDVLSGALSIPAVVTETGAPILGSGHQAPLTERMTRLTPHRVQVLMIVRQDKINKQIAGELRAITSTVKAYISEIIRRIEVIGRTQIMIAIGSLNFDRQRDGYGS